VASSVQIFEAAVDALNRVDRDKLTALLDPDIAFVPLRAAVTGPYLGYRGMEDFLAENAQRFELFQAEFDELRPLRDGRLLAIGFIRMRGHDGTETRYRTAGIATFRGDRMASWHDYGDIAAAEAASRDA